MFDIPDKQAGRDQSPDQAMNKEKRRRDGLVENNRNRRSYWGSIAFTE